MKTVNKMESCLRRTILLFSLIFVSINPAFGGNSIEWIDATNSELFLLDLEPAGIENGVHLLLCRAQHRDVWVTGKIYTDDNQISCVVPYYGFGHSYTEFQILSAPRGSTSWIPHSAKSRSALPPNAIVGGTRPAENNRLVHICRTYHSPTELIVGKFGLGVCWYEVGMKEYQKVTNVEILVVNEYGLAIGANKVIKA